MSFTSWSPGTISIKTVVILLETQRHLKSVKLPGVTKSITNLIHQYLPSQIPLPHLGAILFTPSESNNSTSSLYDIVQRSPRLDQFNVRCSPLGCDIKQSFRSIALGGQPSRYSLLSCATSITLQGYDFAHMADWETVPSFPVLRALAVINCRHDYYLLQSLKAKTVPKLDSLMVKTPISGSTTRYGSFIEYLNPLREFILVGHFTFGLELTGLLPHTKSLELICVHNHIGINQYTVFEFGNDSTDSIFEALENLRHLSCYVDGTSFIDQHGHEFSMATDLSRYLVRTDLANWSIIHDAYVYRT